MCRCRIRVSGFSSLVGKGLREGVRISGVVFEATINEPRPLRLGIPVTAITRQISRQPMWKATSLTYEISTLQESQVSSKHSKSNTTGKRMVQKHDLSNMAIFQNIHEHEFTIASYTKNSTYGNINCDFVNKRIFLPQSVTVSSRVSSSFRLAYFSLNVFTLILIGNFRMRG
jgi:hypothetical protein